MVIFHSFFYVYQRVWKPGSARKCLVSGSTGAVGVKLLVPAGQSRAFPRGKVRDRSPYPDCHPRRRAEASTVGSKGSPMDQSKKSLVGTGDGAWFTNKKHQQDPTGEIRFFTNFNISLRIRPWLAPEMASYFCCLQWLAGRNHCHWKTWFDMVWFFFLGELPTKPKRRTTQSSRGWFPGHAVAPSKPTSSNWKTTLAKMTWALGGNLDPTVRSWTFVTRDSTVTSTTQ